MTNENGSARYVTYKWLLTTIIASMAGLLLITGAIANTTFYHKADGTKTEARVDALQRSMDRIENKIDKLLDQS